MKKEDIIPGNIYHTSYGGGKGWLIRVDRIEPNDKVIYSEYIQNTTYFSVKSPGNWGDWKQFNVGLREATKEEIQHMEACNKEGKFVSQPEYKEPILEIFN